jgi:pyruvate/2-oxoglutarate dehydrogenase complex dihydrolipoamide dehydrogenase (E3) component
MAESTDVIVVGLGPGGEDVAGRLAGAGLDVVGIDGGLVGGECPYWGCIPSKMMIRAANLLAEAKRIDGMAGSASVEPDWSVVADRIRREGTSSWDDREAVERLEGAGGAFVRGWARLVGNGRVAVGDRVFAAERAIVVGTGARPWVPPIAGLADTPYWTNREAIETEEVPATLAVLGGGNIGVELAQVFARFGSVVTVLEAGPRLVVAEEPECSALLCEEFAAEGIDVQCDVTVESVHHDGHRFVLTLGTGAPVVADHVLVATGRRADLDGLNAAAIGVDPSARWLPVDDHLRVEGVEGVWAVGDITGKGAFTHMSMYQADIVVNDILGGPVVTADYRAVPRATFTDPEIGSVGLTEHQAREQGRSVRVGSTQVPASTRGWIHGAGNRELVKLVEDTDEGVLIGATSVGPSGGEVLGLLTLAVHARVPTATLAHMIYAYPTFHRAILPAVRDLEAT